MGNQRANAFEAYILKNVVPGFNILMACGWFGIWSIYNGLASVLSPNGCDLEKRTLAFP